MRVRNRVMRAQSCRGLEQLGICCAVGGGWTHCRYDRLRDPVILQSTSHRWINQDHLYLSPLCVSVLLHFDLHGNLVKDRDGDVLVLRRRDSQRVVFGVVFWFSFEQNDALNPKSIDGMIQIRQVRLISRSCGRGAARTWKQTLRDHS